MPSIFSKPPMPWTRTTVADGAAARRSCAGSVGGGPPQARAKAAATKAGERMPRAIAPGRDGRIRQLTDAVRDNAKRRSRPPTFQLYSSFNFTRDGQFRLTNPFWRMILQIRRPLSAAGGQAMAKLK